jgi:hypothetical protein
LPQNHAASDTGSDSRYSIDAGLAVARHRTHRGDEHEDRQDRHGQLDVGDQQARQADEAEHARFGQAEEEQQRDDAAEDQGVDLEPARAQGFDDVELGGEPELFHPRKRSRSGPAT